MEVFLRDTLGVSTSTIQSVAPLVAGFSGGVVSTTLLLPLDVIKVRLQVNEKTTKIGGGDDTKPTAANHRHRRRHAGSSSSSSSSRIGSWRIITGIVKLEGLGGLYQGWAPAVTGAAISWAGFFYFYEGFKQRLVRWKAASRMDTITSSSSSSGINETTTTQTAAAATTNTLNVATLSSADHFACSCGAGAMMVFITNPVWLIKTRMVLQMKRCSRAHNIEPYKGMVDAARTIVRDEGFFALYKGTVPALMLTSHGGVQFVVYEALRRRFHYRRATRDVTHDDINNDDDNNKFNKKKKKKISPRYPSTATTAPARSLWERLELSAGYLGMGAVSKIAASTVTYPLQVIKSRMQQRSDALLQFTPDGEVVRAVKRADYSTFRGTARHMIRHEGMASFFQGCLPNAVRVAPGAAITFLVYEAVMDWLGV